MATTKRSTKAKASTKAKTDSLSKEARELLNMLQKINENNPEDALNDILCELRQYDGSDWEHGDFEAGLWESYQDQEAIDFACMAGSFWLYKALVETTDFGVYAMEYCEEKQYRLIKSDKDLEQDWDALRTVLGLNHLASKRDMFDALNEQYNDLY